MADSKGDQFVRCFEVSHPRLHRKGHTIYKVTLKTIKVDTPDDDFEETVLWKRYNDFKRLYNTMSSLHRALHRTEEFPPFARSNLFGRFEEKVILERQQSAQDLLNFVGQRKYLVNSQVFQDFLEGGEILTANLHGDPVLEPLHLGCDDSISLESDSDLSSVASSTEHVGKPEPMDEIGQQKLDGVWQHLQTGETLSLDDDDNEHVDAFALPPDMEIFDPVYDGSGEESDSTGPYSNLWLLSALSEFSSNTKLTTESGDDAESKGEITPDSGKIDQMRKSVRSTLGEEPVLGNLSSIPLPKALPCLDRNKKDINIENDIGEFEPNSVFSKRKVSCKHGDDQFTLKTDVVSDSSAVLDLLSLHENDLDGTPLRSATAQQRPSKDDSFDKQLSVVAGPTRSPHRNLMQVDLDEKGKYIVLAARYISLASQCEVGGNYHMAFMYYKNAVGALLTGVQGDDNRRRREVVRSKTAQYLVKAEEIYSRYLVTEGTQDENRWDTGQSSPEQLMQEFDPCMALLKGPVSELANFRVLGLIGKVLLVLDQNSNATYIMKILHKSLPCKPFSNLVPQRCPYMVQLYRFYETETALYLLLEHAPGGKLWTYVSGFLNHQQECCVDEVFVTRNNQQDNIYAGQSLKHSTNGNDLSSPLHENDIKSPSKKLKITTETKNSTQSSSAGDGTNEVFQEDDTEIFQLPGSIPVEPLTAPVKDVHSYFNHFTRMHKTDDCQVYPSSSDNQATSGLSCTLPEFEHRKKRYRSSLSSEESRDDSFQKMPICGIDVKHSLKEADAENQKAFEELLEESAKPTLEHFSIDSFDSDSIPGSRHDSSTSEYSSIYCIPEMKGQLFRHSNKLIEGSSPSSEETVVMTTGDCQVLSAGEIKGHPYGSEYEKRTQCNTEENIVPDINAKTTNIGRDKKAIFSNQNSSKCSSSESVVRTYQDPILGIDVVPRGVDATPLTDIDEGPSIYDRSNNVRNDSDSLIFSHNTDIDKKVPILCDPCDPTQEQALPVPPRSDIGNPKPRITFRESTLQGNNKSKCFILQMKESSKEQNITPSNGKKYHRPLEISLSSNTENKPILQRSLESNFRRLRLRTLSGVFDELDLADEREKGQVHLPEGCIRQWAAEIITAVDFLHQLGIICRDMRPDNILLGDRGHILLTYFSQWNCVYRNIDQTSSSCHYTAPEINSGFNVSPSCDWWSVGVLLFELLTGKSLVSCYPGGITSHTSLVIPDHVSPEGKSLLDNLLRYNPSERLGSGLDGADAIRHHPFFAEVKWADLNG